MTATIFLTGATGLIGFHILLRALAEGHNVRCAVRSEAKAKSVSSNPAVQKIAPGDRLSFVVIPDFTAPGAIGPALEGVTHIIHAGSPVPVPAFDPQTQVFEPTLSISSAVMSAALEAPSVRRVVVTSSIVVNLGVTPPPTAVSASTRVPLPDPVPSTFDGVFPAYVLAKQIELERTDALFRERKPHFTVARVMPGYVFGRNEAALDAVAMQTQNSSNNFLMVGMVGDELPFPIYNAFAHIDDVVDAHLRVAFLEPGAAQEAQTDYGIAIKVDYTEVLGYLQKAYPRAVAEGVFKQGTLTPWPVEYESSDPEKLLGRPYKTFEEAVVEVGAQYLEILGKEKA
ncbi:putative cinnamoyl-CoA reductase [Xylariales sp. PMI_506]|nr:putative cinnamoyl-CoA reductase [Xylariales sp. PMI_506]